MSTDLLAERPPHVPADRVMDIDVYNPPGVADGFHEAWKRLHDPGVPDVIWTPRNGGHWIVTRGKLISQVYSDYEHFSNKSMLVPKLRRGDEKCPRHLVPSYVDPPEHRRYRMLLNASFSPKAIRGMEAMIRKLAVGLIESFEKDGRCEFNAAYAEVLPIKVFMGMVELPMSDFPMVKAWVEQVTRPNVKLSVDQARETLKAVHHKIHDYLRPYIRARAGGDGQDMFSRIINGEVEGRPLSEDEMMDMCTQVTFAGLDTVVNFLGFVFLFLARDTAHRRELVADPSLIPAAVDELLRRYPLVTVGREVCADIRLDGMTLKSGEMVMAPTPLAGTDERMNTCPLEVDFRRNAIEHTTFGEGHHRCPGALLARNEIAISIEEWLKRIPDFEVEPGAQLSFHGGANGGVNALPLVWPAS